MRYRWTTVYRNGQITPAGADLLAGFQREVAPAPPAPPALSRRDAEIVSRQTHARTYGESRSNVRRRDGVERLALGRGG